MYSPIHCRSVSRGKNPCRRPDAWQSGSNGSVVLAFSADSGNEQLANLHRGARRKPAPNRKRARSFGSSAAATSSGRRQQARAQQAIAALEFFLRRADRPVSVEDIQLHFVQMGSAAPENKQAAAPASEEACRSCIRADVTLYGRTPRQRDYIEAILAHDIAFAIGPAAPARPTSPVACAVDALSATRSSALCSPGRR